MTSSLSLPLGEEDEEDIFENLNEGSVLTVMTILIGRVDFVVCGILC